MISFGQPWPIPKNFKQTKSILNLDCDSFYFSLIQKRNDILEDNIRRYKELICKDLGISAYPWKHQELELERGLWNVHSLKAIKESNIIRKVDIIVKNDGQNLPHLYMNES